MDIWAPAAHIISAQHDDLSGHCRLSGTSMAAPHVTGAVALYLDDNPTASPAEVQLAMIDGATCGALDDDPASPYYIGTDSPNLLLNSLLTGGGPSPCENLPPVAVNDVYFGYWEQPLTILWDDLLANDSDPDGDPLEVCDIGDPTVGTITSDDDSSTYTAPYCTHGLVTFRNVSMTLRH